MSDALQERVLVVPTSAFQALGHFQGYCPDAQPYLTHLLQPEHTRFLLRSAAELDPGFKQLIPYVIFHHVDRQGTGHIFGYTRGTGQGEQRLHHKRSIGIGGHISVDDQVDTGPQSYHEGMRREISEEVIVETSYTDRLAGLINDDQTDVGRVHLGIVHVWTVEQPQVRPREVELTDAGFRPLKAWIEDYDRLETWSQICLRALFM